MKAIISRISLYLFTTAISLNMINSTAEARTMHSNEYFRAQYKGKSIYGTFNSYDGSFCTIINNRSVLGRRSGRNQEMSINGIKVKKFETMLFNPVGAKQIPTALYNSHKFQKCIEETMYGKCFISAGSRYYRSSDENFWDVTRKRIPVLVYGQETVPFDRGEDNSYWVSFRFNLQDEGDFITGFDKVKCVNDAWMMRESTLISKNSESFSTSLTSEVLCDLTVPLNDPKGALSDFNKSISQSKIGRSLQQSRSYKGGRRFPHCRQTFPRPRPNTVSAKSTGIPPPPRSHWEPIAPRPLVDQGQGKHFALASALLLPTWEQAQRDPASQEARGDRHARLPRPIPIYLPLLLGRLHLPRHGLRA